MRKLKQLNALPFHQLCRDYLTTLGEEVSDKSLYGLQLAIWGLENSDMTVDLESDTAQLDALIARLAAMAPEELHRLLIGCEDEGDDKAAIKELEDGKRVLLAAAEDPEQAAFWLAEDLTNRM